ncbi:hypothetical protein ABZ532_20720 [Streptomyces sp. NPDC019396]|uniref:hypothetical protein n=1 Tax=Streptomyces sp. NPDC019396 TaxID=3154687 RepID=UPI003408E96F
MSSPSPSEGVRDGLRRLDGYLYWQAELAEARSEATAFCETLPWLTTAERRELEEQYTRARVEMSKAVTRRIANRCVELRMEYETRYRNLRRRTIALSLAGCCLLLTVGELLRR